MPLVRIDLPAGNGPAYRQLVADIVYEAMLAELKVPAGDRFQIIAEHEPDTLLIDPSYLGIARSPQALVIQITLNEGRATEVKQGFYKAVADGLFERVGIRREDVTISLVEVKKENWSFGNGIAQYA